jgi:hypothetical protein
MENFGPITASLNTEQQLCRKNKMAFDLQTINKTLLDQDGRIGKGIATIVVRK